MKSPQSISVISSRFGTSGYRSDSREQANPSISETAMSSHPRGLHATVAASIPLKTLR